MEEEEEAEDERNPIRRRSSEAVDMEGWRLPQLKYTSSIVGFSHDELPTCCFRSRPSVRYLCGLLCTMIMLQTYSNGLSGEEEEAFVVHPRCCRVMSAEPFKTTGIPGVGFIFHRLFQRQKLIIYVNL